MANADETKTTTTTNDNGTTEDAKEVEVAVKEEPKEVEVVVKKEPIVLTKELEEKIIRQVEYYFGDINLPRDKFLLEQISLDEGWVPLTVLLTFKRLLAICDDPETIAKALVNSENDLIIVNDEHTKVRRNPELPVPEYNEERRKELTSRTAYVKGFPLTEELESIEKYMRTQGPVESIYMRTYKDKISKKFVFKGSIFAIYKDIESCKKFIEAEEIKFNDTPLIRKWQADYLDEKKKERDEKHDKRARNKKDCELKKPQFPKGAILFMSGFKDDTVRESIKKQVTEIGNLEVAYITFDKGDTEGYLRFSEENAANEFVKKLTDSKFTVDDAEITVRALEGDEEDKFLTELTDTMTKMRHHHKSSGGRGKKRKGGRDGGPRHKHGKRD